MEHGIGQQNQRGLDRETFAARLLTRGKDGQLLSAITGNESTAQLREIILEFTNSCPANLQHPDCPFRILNGLYPGSLRGLLNGMTRPALLNLFDMELKIRTSHAASRACFQNQNRRVSSV